MRHFSYLLNDPVAPVSFTPLSSVSHCIQYILGSGDGVDGLKYALDQVVSLVLRDGVVPLQGDADRARSHDEG